MKNDKLSAIPTFSKKFQNFLEFLEILQIISTSRQIVTLSANFKEISPHFHEHEAEKASFFIRRIKFHFSFAKI